MSDSWSLPRLLYDRAMRRIVALIGVRWILILGILLMLLGFALG
jgi:hypothetical protein